jgi:2-oxoisovalerate dehydrogenase E1 component beta subunit
MTLASSSMATLSKVVASKGPPGRVLNLCDAVNSALTAALSLDPTTIVFGEDIAFGGVFRYVLNPWQRWHRFSRYRARTTAHCARHAKPDTLTTTWNPPFSPLRCTKGLQERFGKHRVFNTPLSESGIVGFGIGAAAANLRPVAEIQFADYIFPAMDQIVNEASKYRYRSGGIWDVGGLTIRAPWGAVGKGGHYHSSAPEAFLTHAAGLKVVIPSSPREAKGLLLASIADPNPVVFFEPKRLYRLAEELVPQEAYMIPLGKARIARPGEDVTIVAWGQSVVTAEQAADALEERGVRCEIIDLRTLTPLDVPSLAQSVKKTGRLIVVHEAPKTSGFGAEIVASITEACWADLKAEPVRVCAWDVPGVPYALEDHYLPTVNRILRGVASIL